MYCNVSWLASSMVSEVYDLFRQPDIVFLVSPTTIHLGNTRNFITAH